MFKCTCNKLINLSAFDMCNFIYLFTYILFSFREMTTSLSAFNLQMFIIHLYLYFVLDLRDGYCFLQLTAGRCQPQTSTVTLSKTDCCCALAAAWGPACERCPSRNSSNILLFLCPCHLALSGFSLTHVCMSVHISCIWSPLNNLISP